MTLLTNRANVFYSSPTNVDFLVRTFGLTVKRQCHWETFLHKVTANDEDYREPKQDEGNGNANARKQ